MATRNKVKVLSNRYLIINLSTLLKFPNLSTMVFQGDKEQIKNMKKMNCNSYAVSEKHPSIILIALTATNNGAYWQHLPGDHDLVKSLI